MFTYPLTGDGPNPLANLKQDLVSWWTLDEQTGDLYDSHNHAKLTRAVFNSSLSGVVGGCLTSSNTSASVYANENFADPSIGTFSVGAWAKHNTDSSLDRLFQISNGSSDGCYLNHSSGTWTFAVYDSSIGDYRTVTKAGAANTWSYVVVSFDAATGTMVLYVDGSASATNTVVSPVSPVTNQFQLGSNLNGGWVGDIDEAAVWDRLLTEGEINELSTNPTGYSSVPDIDEGTTVATNLTSWWSLDETSGNRADEKAARTLTDYNTVGSTTGKFSTSADFVASNGEYLENAAAGIDLTSAFSISGWFKVNSVGASDRFTILSLGTSPTANPAIFFDTYGTDLRLYTYTSAYVGAVAATVAADTWYHFTIISNPGRGNKGAVYLYLDNVMVLAVYNSAQYSGIGQTLRLGRSNNATNRYLDGSVDEVGLWEDEALSRARVSWLYNSGAGRQYSDLS